MVKFNGVECSSISSVDMYFTTLSRNEPGILNKITAQVKYALIAMLAVAETITALVSSILFLLSYPHSSNLGHSIRYLSSSAFAIGWSIGDFCRNLYLLLFDTNAKMTADEQEARLFIKNTTSNLMINLKQIASNSGFNQFPRG